MARLTRSVSIALFAIVLAPASLALANDVRSSKDPHHTDSVRAPGVPAYVNPKAATVNPAAVVAVDGKVTLHVAVAIHTPGLGIKQFECDVYAEPYGPNENDEDGRFVYVPVSGNSVTCDVTINLHWNVDPALDKLDLWFYLYGYDATGKTVRYHAQTITYTAPIPTGGATAAYGAYVIF